MSPQVETSAPTRRPSPVRRDDALTGREWSRLVERMRALSPLPPGTTPQSLADQLRTDPVIRFAVNPRIVAEAARMARVVFNTP